MRRTACVRVLALVSLLSLAFVFPGCSPFGLHVPGLGFYSGSSSYTEYADGPVSPSGDADTVSVSWISGDVTVRSGTELSVSEEGTAGTYLPLYWRVKDGKLEIRFVRSGTDNADIDNLSKKLVITVPESVRTVTLDLVSGTYSVEADDLDLLDVDAVSANGDVRLGSVGKIKCDTVSGSLFAEVRDTSRTEELDMDSVSGNAEFSLGTQKGCRADFDTVSGKFDSTLPEPDSDDAPAFRADMDSVSGNLTIHEYEPAA